MSAPSAPTPGASQSAVAAFHSAARHSAGYRAWLASRGIEPDDVRDIAQVPYLVKTDVFGERVAEWVVGGRLSAAAELLTSSGRGGRFSIGVTSHDELAALQDTADLTLRALGASDDTATLLLNCLPAGIAIPTTVATVATPSVNLEMAQEIYERLGPDFDRIVVLAEPVVLKELAERLHATHGGPWSAAPTGCIVGGEWVSESWRAHVGSLFGMARTTDFADIGILISMGAAEVGLNLLFETAVLRALRTVLDAGDRGASLVRDHLGYTPSLFTYDPRRALIEERAHPDGVTTLAVTPLHDRLLPLVRYDLDDRAEIVDPALVEDALRRTGLPGVEGPVVAFWGRRSDGVVAAGRTVRPEHVKQRLFAKPAEASLLTGRFFLQGGDEPVLHLQLRPDADPPPDVAAGLAGMLRDVSGADGSVTVHAHDAYPFHASGDFQHKPVYHGAG